MGIVHRKSRLFGGGFANMLLYQDLLFVSLKRAKTIYDCDLGGTFSLYMMTILTSSQSSHFRSPFS